MPANEKKLGKLHDKVADVLIGALDRAEEKAVVDQDLEKGIFAEEINPALLSVATKFLKDNEITCVADANNKTGDLRSKLNKRKQSVDNVTYLAGGE